MNTEFFNRAKDPQPSMMTVFAQAVWDKEKGGWVVDLIQTESVITRDQQYTIRQNKDSVFVQDCDELVIADALLFSSGVEVHDLDYTERDDVVVRGV